MPERAQQALFVLRARLSAGLADFAEAWLTLSLVSLTPKAPPADTEELAAWRSRWSDAIQPAMGQGPGGSRATFLTLSPPGLGEALDRSFVHAVAFDATLEEAQAIARWLTTCGDAEDLAVAREPAERYPAAADWPGLFLALGKRKAH